MLRALPLAAVLTIGLVPLVARANINAIESADFSNAHSTPTNLGTVGQGLNTIQGSVAGVRAVPQAALGGDNFDAFMFTVPLGMVVTSVRVDIAGWSSIASGGGAMAGKGEAGNSSGVAAFQSFTGNTTLANIVSTPEGVIAPGTYTFWANAGDSVPLNQRQAGDALSFTYLYTITVVPLTEYIEGVSGADVSAAGLPFGTLAAPTAGASDGAAVHLGGSISVTAFGNSMVPPTWRGDVDVFTFTIPAGTAGARLALAITGLTTAGAFSTPPAGAIQLVNATTGESYVRSFTGNDTLADLMPVSTGRAMSAGDWTITMATTAPSPLIVGQSLSYTYSLRFITAIDSGACCNRWTGSCMVTSAGTCGGLGLNLLGFGAACSPGACRACPADFDGNGTLGVADVFAMLNAWFAGCP